MRRRQLLGAASAGLASALWPSLVREAFGEQTCEGAPLARLAQVVAAYRRARASGKVLLVFVIPQENMARAERGQVFGELLNHGSDRDLAPLAAAEVVCSTMEDLRRLVPNAGMGEPLMVLIQPDKVPASARQLDTRLEPNPGFEGGWEEQEQREDAASDKRIAAMGDLLRRALGDDARRAGALAASVRARLKDKAPAGTRWARMNPCGVDIEGDDDQRLAAACGMGHVPKKAERFLYFYAKGLY